MLGRVALQRGVLPLEADEARVARRRRGGRSSIIFVGGRFRCLALALALADCCCNVGVLLLSLLLLTSPLLGQSSK